MAILGVYMLYPGRVVKVGGSDGALVQAIAQELRQWKYTSSSPVGVFDKAFASVVSLFQAQHSDQAGRPLKIDGKLGPLTWGALFRVPVPVAVPPAGPGVAALDVAIAEIGTMEDPLGSNSGPSVNQYLAAAGLPPGNFWCMSFVVFCFREASARGGFPNPFPRTGGCVDAWNRVSSTGSAHILTRAKAAANPALVQPGMVFILDFGGGHGHTGFVRSSTGGALRTVEGNADPQGGSNGLGVLELNRRSVMDKALKGFITF